MEYKNILNRAISLLDTFMKRFIDEIDIQEGESSNEHKRLTDFLAKFMTVSELKLLHDQEALAIFIDESIQKSKVVTDFVLAVRVVFVGAFNTEELNLLIERMAAAYSLDRNSRGVNVGGFKDVSTDTASVTKTINANLWLLPMLILPYVHLSTIYDESGN